MVKKEMVDVNNLTFVDASEVPESLRTAAWDAIFKGIPEGKALVLTGKDIQNTRQALRNRHKKQKFLDLVLIEREQKGFVSHKK